MLFNPHKVNEKLSNLGNRDKRKIEKNNILRAQISKTEGNDFTIMFPQQEDGVVVLRHLAVVVAAAAVVAVAPNTEPAVELLVSRPHSAF